MTITLAEPATPSTATDLEVAPLTIAGRTFRSRLFLGTGKYPDFATMAAALEASGTEVVTVALRRVNLDERGKGSLLDFVDPAKYLFLPNTAGCYTADEAIRTARPWGVDLSSGIETSPGLKDRAKMERFLAAVRAVPSA